MKDQLTILRHNISERSKDTTLVWASQSSCLRDQLTILRLGLIKHLSERSVDNTSVRKKIFKIFFMKKIFFVKKYFYEKKIFFVKKKILRKKYIRQNLRNKNIFMKKNIFYE